MSRIESQNHGRHPIEFEGRGGKRAASFEFASQRETRRASLCLEPARGVLVPVEGPAGERGEPGRDTQDIGL